jgi:hypothetical protein
MLVYKDKIFFHKKEKKNVIITEIRDKKRYPNFFDVSWKCWDYYVGNKNNSIGKIYGECNFCDLEKQNRRSEK